MDASTQQSARPRSGCHAACWLLICALCWSTGCAGTGSKARGSQVTAASVFRNPFEKQKAREIIDPDAGFDEYDIAMAKFEKKEYQAAAKEFKQISKKFYDHPVEEDAMFMVGECHFAEQRYAHAQDDYDGLIKKFPSSRYLEKTTRRLYTIAAIWLNGDGTTKTDELIQVSSTDVTDREKVDRKPVPHSLPLVPNLFDKTRPLFDTPGNARKALKSVWLHDPLGPLADDALMMTAVYHIRKGQLRDADHYLEVLRREYPKSEHTQNAFVVGSHIKLASYQGARYDGQDLVDADDLIHSTLNLYPNLPERAALESELTKINQQGAERLWSRSEYYKNRRKLQSEAIYLESLLKEFPESPLAGKAAARLKELGPKYWTGMLEHYPDPNSGTIPKPAKPKTAEKAPEGPQFLRKRAPNATPPAKAEPADEELPPARPRSEPSFDPSFEDPAETYEELPPVKKNVDPPDLVDSPSDEEIERTAFDPPAGRAKP